MRDSDKIKVASAYLKTSGKAAVIPMPEIIKYGMEVLKQSEYEAGLADMDDAFYLWYYDTEMPICLNCTYWRDKAWNLKGWGICDNPINQVRLFATALVNKFCVDDTQIRQEILHSIRYPEDFGCRFFGKIPEGSPKPPTIDILSDQDKIDVAKSDYDSSFGVGRGEAFAKAMIHNEYAMEVLKLEPDASYPYAQNAVISEDFDEESFYSWYYTKYMDGYPR